MFRRNGTKRIRFPAFLERYVEDHLKIQVAKSWESEMGRVRRIARFLGDAWMDRITTSDVERFLSDMKREGLSSATVNRYHARLSSMLSRAVAWGHREDNPASRISFLKEKHLPDRYLKPGEFRALLDELDPDMRVFVHMAAMTGMRRGELLPLRWEDVDLEEGFLLVRASHSKTSEGRIVPLNSQIRKVLQDYRKTDEGRVFPFRNYPRKRWEAARRRLGWDRSANPRLSGWRFHDLRHTCASWLVMADVPLSKVGKILGHKELKTTQRYAHLADSALLEAVERIRVGPDDRTGSS